MRKLFAIINLICSITVNMVLYGGATVDKVSVGYRCSRDGVALLNFFKVSSRRT